MFCLEERRSYQYLPKASLLVLKEVRKAAMPRVVPGKEEEEKEKKEEKEAEEEEAEGEEKEEEEKK